VVFRSRLIDRLLFGVLLLLPNQLGLHFWPTWTYVSGLRIDYLSPTLYLSYLLIGLVLLTVVWKRRGAVTRRPGLLLVVTGVTTMLVIYSVSAAIPAAAWWRFEQILLALCLGVVIYKYQASLRLAWLGLALGFLWTALLAIGQFLVQHSLGFWLLGERSISVVTPGAADLTYPIFGYMLRPYATFSHPNSLAGFLLVGLLVLYLVRRFIPAAVYWLTFPLMIIVLLLAGSRGVLIVGIIILICSLVFQLFPYRKTVRLLAILGLGGIITSALWQFTPGILHGADLSVRRRAEENLVAWKFIATAPLRGVGGNNFIIRLGPLLPSSVYPTLSGPVLWLQPVHNIFLLMTAEYGLIGLSLTISFLGIVVKRLRQSNRPGAIPLTLAVMTIVLTGLFDHYWLTLLQNQLLAALVFSLALKSDTLKRNG
jgi:O-antigen ligase